ncbi:aminopeptidase [Saccharomycopsis crataegensis]|uniref:Aminopeptidase n=1 Tax=Saccharomycopsis crataegensis TaxID=43959 RepID=A0AAV5QF30_9ASCO|nr:aminopeptidase [Saccharomycopsis crataegensis]
MIRSSFYLKRSLTSNLNRLNGQCKHNVNLRRYSQRIIPEINAGQPLYETRPHMLRPGELTPGITALEYFERRLKLGVKMKKGSVAVIPGNQVKYASGAVFYKFQQNTDLFYLTGWEEPDSVALIEHLEDESLDPADRIILHMIVPPKDAHTEQWEGFRTGVNGAVEIFNADEGASNKDLKQYISKIVQRYDTVYFDQNFAGTNSGSSIFKSFFSISEKGPQWDTISDVVKSSKSQIKSLTSLVRDLRAKKSNAEIDLIRTAGKISGRAYNEAYANRFKNERTLASFLEHKFISGGCDGHAYVPVVAGGPNALSIHYTRNDDVFYDDELVLVDAGGKLAGYRADISRTWPISGKFTDPQRDLYQAVLNVNKECIKMCRADSGKSLHDIHLKSVDLLLKELIQLPGLGDLKYWDVTKLYPHYVGHNLGLDVHDIPSYSRSAPLIENQVITIEPGVYFPLNDTSLPSYYRGIGIRVEDNVAIGWDTNTVLTTEAAKEIIDIETIAENGLSSPYKSDIVDILEQD